MSEPTVFDICIVGGGPGGLAALSALIEPYSIDQLTDAQSHRAAHSQCKKNRSSPPSVCVVDPKPWLDTWHRRFKALDIKWLRSPAGAHPDIFDQNSLLAFAVNGDRQNELWDSGVLDSANLHKLTESGSGIWSLPTNQLFEDFCSELASRLPHTFVHGEATAVSGHDGDFSIGLADGRHIQAKIVVLALGVPGPPIVPAVLADVPESLLLHSDHELGARLQELEQKKRVLVIGGGLTAVQVSQLAVKKGCKVVQISRRPHTTRHIDLNESWFNRHSASGKHYEFFEKPFEERLKHVRTARGGGSVPPMYMKWVREAEADGSLVIKCAEAQLVATHDSSVDVMIDGEVSRFDLIVTACGHRPDCQHLPLVRELLKVAPVDVVGGFPTLSQDLQWGDFKQLFVMGALASLQVGPDAGNLMGLRRAAKVLSNSLNLWAWQKKTSSVLGNIRGNRYAALESDSDSEASTADQASVDDGSLDSEEDRQRLRSNS